MTIGLPAAAARCAADPEALEVRLDDLVEGQALLGRELRGVAHLRVDDAVGGEVLGALRGDADDRVAVLEDADGVLERLEVQLERLAVGAAAEPRRELVDVGRRQARVAVLATRGRPRSRAAARRRGGRAGAPWAPAGSCRASAREPPEVREMVALGWSVAVPRLRLVTEAKDAPAALAWESESGGVEWHVELDRAVLLPGRLVGGRLSLLATATRRGTPARGRARRRGALAPRRDHSQRQRDDLDASRHLARRAAPGPRAAPRPAAARRRASAGRRRSTCRSRRWARPPSTPGRRPRVAVRGQARHRQRLRLVDRATRRHRPADRAPPRRRGARRGVRAVRERRRRGRRRDRLDRVRADAARDRRVVRGPNPAAGRRPR